ncbi:MAG: DUF1156 domain-containing protein, partial [FCB group bacterium]|nr:DUF1156 domain-containing protein [FCB group bacterium]
MSNSFPPRLIEVALPIREISAESVRDKSLRHGHISTLHLWWARRPLSAARAIVFASLVPDPDDPRCPPDFRDAVERLLKINVPTILKSYYRGRREIIDSDPYKPYDGIPDTPRNRLLTFIAQWSPESLEFEAGKRKEPPQPKELLDDRSLVKWETSDPKNPQGREVLCIARELVKTAHNGETPTVLDPFAGGGAIPLEAGRLGCQPIANDYNPVAYLILRATCEFPQKYGKPGKRKKIVKEFGKEIEREVEVPNVLAHDFEKWANWILEQARAKIGHLYPPGKVGRPVIGYLWARTAPCSNPSCRAEILLLRSLLVCNKPNKKVALTLEVDRTKKTVSFGITKDKDIKRTEGTALSRGVKCPFCEQITSVDHIKAASFNSQMHERIVAVIVKDKNGKDYRPVEDSDVSSFQLAEDLINPELTPNEPMQEVPDLVSGRGWNFKTWGSLFNPRQLVAMQTFVSCMRQALEEMKAEIPDEEYRKAVGIYLSIFISKISMVQSSFGTYSVTRENIKSPFGRQAIPMVWDYPESNPFSDATAGIEMQIDFLLKTIKHESINSHAAYLQFNDANSINFKNDTISTVITDPPYFDAIAYSDLSDFFYVWLKRCLSDISPEAFQTPLTPKSEEATALKHRHQGSSELADTHFQNKLTQALAEAHRKVKPGGIVTVMFAHQSTKAWTALINAILNGGLTIDAS